MHYNIIEIFMNILIDKLAFPEGPAIDKKGNIWLVEKEAGNLIWYHNGVTNRIFVDGQPNGIAIDTNGIIWFCDSKKNSIRAYDPNNKECKNIIEELDGIALKMPNDLCFDSNGNLLFTCPGNSLDDNSGYICFLDKEGNIRKLAENLNYPNGLAFSKDGLFLYLAETGSKWIWKYDWNPLSFELSNPTQFYFTGGEIGPDGMAFDEDGMLYIAVYSKGVIVLVSSTGEEISQIKLKGNNPTNCCLSSTNNLGLIITEAELGQLIQITTHKKGIL